MTPTDISKFLSYVLRHHPDSIGIALDAEGWAAVDALLAQAARHGKRFSREAMLRVVETNDKRRFALSEDGSRIRAVQGHSAPGVAISHTQVTPPEWLYHGTATRFLAAIRAEGLLPGSRHYVHLSVDEPTAVKVGSRHGKPVVLKVRALAMHAAGSAFFLAENGVWLTRQVPPAFLD